MIKIEQVVVKNGLERVLYVKNTNKVMREGEFEAYRKRAQNIAIRRYKKHVKILFKYTII
jgi:hypothetical protein